MSKWPKELSRTYKTLVEQKKERIHELQEEIVRKEAFLAGLPSVEVCRLESPNVRFVRLRSPKEDGQSLKKKQCDLWEFCWGSSALLAYAVTKSLDLTGKSTLELGGGIGVATLAVASTFATSRSVMTDLVEDALKIFSLSTKVGGLKGPVKGQVLNWNKLSEFQYEAPFDLVMGSDVLFMSWCCAPVAKVVATCLADDGIMIVVDPYRLNDAAFLSSLEAHGIKEQAVIEIPGPLIETLVGSVLDSRGSVVPVKRAKLIVASRQPIPSSILEVFH